MIETADRSVAVWHLHLDPGQSTSMHMHKIKRTALVVLGGLAKVQFMTGTPMLVEPLAKVVFRPGQYHQTTANQQWGLDLLEIETPSDKQDLVRLEDRYGRAGKGYEGAESLEEDDSGLKVEPLKEVAIGQYQLWLTEVTERTVANLNGVIIFLSGGIRRSLSTTQQQRGSMPVLSPGDVVEAETLRRLASKYDLLKSEVLEVSRA